MNKLSAIFSSVFLVASVASEAQVVNRALNFTDTGSVDCGAMPRLDGAESYSLQMWIKPEVWSPEASLISRGNDFKLGLGANGSINIISRDSDFTFTHPDLKTGEWNQITLICNDGEAIAMVNGEIAGKGELKPIERNSAPLIIGGGYTGLLDEVRIYDAALDGRMAQFDYFTHNTLNRWCPMWENLAAYYKTDQEDTPYLIDYKALEDGEGEYNNHGLLSEGVEKVEACNDKMPYLINAAYTNNERFYDSLIPLEQYQLCNDLIILGVDVYAEDGRLETKTPNNHALKIKGGKYLDEHKGRRGVLALDGQDSYMRIPGKTLKYSDGFTYETQLYIEEWQPGAALLSTTDENGVRILMDKDNTLTLRVNGKEAMASDLPIKLNAWNHIGLTANGDDVKFYVNGETCPAETPVDFDATPEAESGDILIGRDVECMIDETCLWNMAWNEDYFTGIGKVPMPGPQESVARPVMHAVGAYYRFDNPENLGYSSHSQDEWLNIMKGMLADRAGMKYYISVQGTYKERPQYGDWRKVLYSSEKRGRLADDLAKISENYDGVELDLEWIENPEEWRLFGVLAEEIRKVLPEDKGFRISLHNNYTAFPKENFNAVDGFTFQQYGPNARNFSYDNFLGNVEKFIGSYDRDKIMTSYSTTSSKGDGGAPVIGIGEVALKEYSQNENDIDKYTAGEETWSYAGPMQVYRRAKHTREQNLQGIFYWDMANDNLSEGGVMPEFNQAKYCSFGINANNDRVVSNDLVPNHLKE